ncbi:unnamed protein product [Trifolium pratense]|uniref:Uncharacterized protein n=1 Tax=Trifolium pratense TaxID=57577 RepID=A0ACB0J5L4_TRIPR|nr:unnamed protein product [Trifolium pratense]
MTRASSASAKSTQKSPGMKKKKLQGKKRGRPTSKKSGADIWAFNWFVRPKIWRNGREDYFYIHKYEDGLICRSLKEVERFEKDGTRPGRKAKRNSQKK